MGYIVSCEGREIWSPSLTVGELFYKQIKNVETVVGKDSGISNPFDDELEIDKEKFIIFIQDTVNFLSNTQNLYLRFLLKGILIISIYLNYRIEGKWLDLPPELKDVSEKVLSLGGA